MSALAALYAAERARLYAHAPLDTPAGEYAAPCFGEGPAHAPLLLLGEAPGAEETRLSRPFVGKAGRQLDALLEIAGLSRAALFLTNTVKYRPVTRTARGAHNRTPGRGEIRAALPLLRAELLAVAPRVIVTLGNTPLSAVLALEAETGETTSAKETVSGTDTVKATVSGTDTVKETVSGTDTVKATVSVVHGKPLPLQIGALSVTLFPLYHPASGIYNPKLVAVMERDAAALREHLVKQGHILAVREKM